jgi:hypothetical protein
MDAIQDCIIGVFSNYGLQYPGIEAYMVSLARCGYRGRKVLLVWNLRPEVREILTDYGYELVEVPPPAPETQHLPVNFFIHRMKVVADYLEDHWAEFRYVYWLDIKDLILQTDPSVWMEQNKGEAKIIASTECVTLGEEETNNKWIKDVCGADIHSWLKDHEVINGGTFAGESEIMARLFRAVHEFIKDYIGPWPACQPAINYVLRTPGFIEHLRIPRWTEGFAACLHPMWACGYPSNPRDLCRPYLRDTPPAIDIEKRTLYARTKSDPANLGLRFAPNWGGGLEFEFMPNYKQRQGIECIEAGPNDTPFCIVHGWDRDWGMKHFFEQTYALPRLEVLTRVYKGYKESLGK